MKVVVVVAIVGVVEANNDEAKVATGIWHPNTQMSYQLHILWRELKKSEGDEEALIGCEQGQSQRCRTKLKQVKAWSRWQRVEAWRQRNNWDHFLDFDHLAKHWISDIDVLGKKSSWWEVYFTNGNWTVQSSALSTPVNTVIMPNTSMCTKINMA